MSFLIQGSIEMGTPTIGVSFSYRVSRFGLVSGRAFNDSSLANLGLYDQQTALHSIQENIDAFGGDPTRVTIQAESSGALSVRYHHLAYDGLFRAAITQSSAPLSTAALIPLDEQERIYQDVLNATGCTAPIEPIECLRKAPVESLKAAFQGTGYISSGMFGAINTGAELRAVITGFRTGKYLTNDTTDRIVDGYPQLPIWEFRANLGTVLIFPSSKYGSLYGYSTLLNPGCPFIAISLRLFLMVRPLGPSVLLTSKEVAFVFNNSEGVGLTVPPLCSSDGQMERRLRDVRRKMALRLLTWSRIPGGRGFIQSVIDAFDEYKF
ncbi:putative neuroligin [Aspergillus nomiae NRRL 13137]|uniref:Putative neuroligin n=1 Tax=Aspergillus nomiae NRRL (strain ATCC 15546 / NRRL 13137 / CBS 260.88 / M93) TaxID=1509407 RepID=A0A0L1IZ54_ASPN3|nr:putative neuroligin [Aspergillus nomiae NRRL 13137]KNG84799.1 putative neuroligin [Aspergillus nomiae NRRL 13137]